MKPAAREWVRCAEEDFDVAAALLRRRTKTAANSIGFHCQQCVEKYLKARLEEAGGNAPKTHDLVALLNCCCQSNRCGPLLRRGCAD
jgi:HEPN domain-containing protein